MSEHPKGAILQRDKETYAIVPRSPVGLVKPEELENIVNVVRKYDIPIIKITSGQRFALVGIKKEDVDNIWKDLGMDPGHAVGLCVRSIKTCPGTTFCKLAQTDSLSMGMKLDEIYHGMQLPSKMKMAVSGCKIQCAEKAFRDRGSKKHRDRRLIRHSEAG